MDPVDRPEVEHDHGDDGKHVPIRMRDPLVKEREKRILGRDGEHIVHLHELARGIEHVMRQTIAVDGQVDGVNGGIRRESDANRGQNTAGRKLGEPKLKEQDRNAALQRVRKIVEEKGPAKKLRLGHRIVQHERHEGAERPEQKQIAGNALTRQHRDRQKHGRKRIADLLIAAINDEWEAIKGYNDLVSALSYEINNNPAFSQMIAVINDINAEENKHVGQLQEILKTISPNANMIREGEVEGKKQFNFVNGKLPVQGVKIISQERGEIPVNGIDGLAGDGDTTCTISNIDDEW